MLHLPGHELRDLEANLGTTRSNVADLRGRIETVSDAVDTAKQALELPGKVEQQAGDFIATIKSAKFSLKIAEKVGPMKVVAKALDTVLDRLESVAGRLRADARELDRKIDESGAIETLERAGERLDSARESLIAAEVKLVEYRLTVGGVNAGFGVAGPAADGVETVADAAVAPLNDLVEGINGTYAAISDELDALRSGFTSGLFDTMVRVGKSFATISGALSGIAGPLKSVHAALKPLEPLLDAAGLVYRFTVGPVVDWLMDKLGITRLMKVAADRIGDFLPRPEALVPLVDGIDRAFDRLEGFLDADGWAAGLDEIIDDLTAGLFPGLEAGADGAIRIGTAVSDTLTGRDSADILAGLGGNDTIDARGGDDVILAGGGENVVFGGEGFDRLVLSAPLDQFRLTATEDGGPIVLTHLGGRLGVQIAHSVEEFVFSNVRLTRTQLLENIFVAEGPELVGTPGADFLYARSTAVRIEGRGGDDLVTGSPQGDQLFGGPGNDTIVPGDGADLAHGGSGSDTWLVAEDARPGNPVVEVDLVTGIAWDGYGRDTLVAIENVTVIDNRSSELFGDRHANVIRSAGGRDWIDGRKGDDLLFGGGGRDILIGGRGTDTLFGGEGNDTLVGGGTPTRGETLDGGPGRDMLIYSADLRDYDVRTDRDRPIPGQDPTGSLRILAGTGVIERLAADLRTVLARDVAVGIEEFVGSDSNDTLFGGRPGAEGVLVIDGGGGDDLLYSDGATQVRGGKGNDTLRLRGDQGNVSFDGGSGDDVLDTRGFDARWFLRLQGSIGTRIEAYRPDEASDLGDGSGNSAERATLLFSGNIEGIEAIRLGGSDDEVWLQGSERVTVFGGGGDDRLYRWQANDGSSRGVLHGEAGDDHLELQIEGELYGGAGNDRLVVSASGRGHVVDGGGGDDVVTVRRMNGTLDGGGGFDSLALDVAHTRVPQLIIDLAAGTIASPGDLNSITATAVRNFEEVIGDDVARNVITGAAAGERLIGGAGDDAIAGGGGNDEVFGGAGNDLLSGGAGDDTLHGGLGNDTIDGGEGVNTVSYANVVTLGPRGALGASGFGGVAVNLATGLAAGAQGNDRLAGIRNVTGSSGNDSLRGDDAGNALIGGAGNDMLEGGGGDDVLVAGEGNDTVFGGDGDDVIVLGTGTAVIDGGAGIDTLHLGSLRGTVSVSLRDGNYAAEVLQDVPVWRDTGGTEARLHGAASLTPADVLRTDPVLARSVADLARVLPAPGSTGADRFEIATTTEVLSLAGSFAGIRAVEGGAARERVAGTGDDDTISGGGGNDTLGGAGGSDVLDGGQGRDRLTGGQGADSLTGARGDDTLVGGGGNDRLDGGAGRDALTAGSGRDVLVGGGGDDSLNGGAGNDRLDGGYGRDLLKGGAGDDLVQGLAGADTLVGGPGDDTLSGGAGADTFAFARGHGRATVRDFDPGEGDVLQLDAGLWRGSLAAAGIVDRFAANEAGSTRLEFPRGEVMILRGFTDIDLLKEHVEIL
jgi:Ca2+-binding RTX toxin-like protein